MTRVRKGMPSLSECLELLDIKPPTATRKHSTHPNRPAQKLGHWPTRMEVVLAREASRLTPEQAANLVYRTVRAWQYWETGDRPMPADTFELFLIKTGQTPVSLQLKPRDL